MNIIVPEGTDTQDTPEQSPEEDACICAPDEPCLGVPGESDACDACLALDPEVACLHDACDDCGHIHTPHGCTGDPTPSDLWAGVSVATCDCIPIEDLGGSDA